MSNLMFRAEIRKTLHMVRRKLSTDTSEGNQPDNRHTSKDESFENLNRLHYVNRSILQDNYMRYIK